MFLRYSSVLHVTLLPTVADVAYQTMRSVAAMANTTLADLQAAAVAADDPLRAGFFLPLRGLASLSANALLISLLWGAILATAIDRRFIATSAWVLLAAILCLLGIIHADTPITWTLHGFFDLEDPDSRYRIL